MKTKEEIEAVHDMLNGLLTVDDCPITPDTRKAMDMTVASLCWILEHEVRKEDFPAFLIKLELWLLENGLRPINSAGKEVRLPISGVLVSEYYAST